MCRYLERKAPERLVDDHGDGNSVRFRARGTLEVAGVERIRVILGRVCPGGSFRDGLFGFAIDGGRQTLATLHADVADRV